MECVTRHTSRVISIAVVCLALLNLPAFAATGMADGPDLLVNGGMEGSYVQQCTARGGAPWVAVPCGNPIDFGTTVLWQTAQVPLGWVGWWRPPNTNNDDPNFYSTYPYRCGSNAPPGCAAWHNPEFRDTAGGPKGPPSRKVAGDNSQKYFTFYSLHEAGLYQTVGGLRPGQGVRFSVHMQAWSSQENDPFHSAGQPTMGLRVGIDPSGGNNPWSDRIVWSPVKEAFDHWELFTVEAVAKSDRVTVFTRSRPHFAVQHNDVYVDEASLVVVSEAPVSGTPPATPSSVPPRVTATPTRTASPTLKLTLTATRMRTATRTPTPTPTPTLTPSATPLPTETPTATSTPTATLPAVFVRAPTGSEPLVLAGGVIITMLFVAFVVVRVSSSPANE